MLWDRFADRIKKGIKRLIFLSRVNCLLAGLIQHSIVLGFHRIKPVTSSLLDEKLETIDPKVFRVILTHLGNLGYRFISLSRLASNTEEGKSRREAVITFDDGFKDLHEYAYPILKELGIPFTLFLITSTLDSPRLLWLHKIIASLEKMNPEARIRVLREASSSYDYADDEGKLLRKSLFSLSKNELLRLSEKVAEEAGFSCDEEREIAKKLYLSTSEIKEMLGSGLELEPHTHEHWPAGILDERQMDNEINLSRKIITHNFGVAPSFFCLPYGRGMGLLSGAESILTLRGVCSDRIDLIPNSCWKIEVPRIMVRTDAVDLNYELFRLLAKSAAARLLGPTRKDSTVSAIRSDARPSPKGDRSTTMEE
jgi:peptidoglycan/xylan/chitin deacetylase (PgdA/CDA1 family)